MATELGRLNVTVTANIGDLERKMTAVGSSVQRLTKAQEMMASNPALQTALVKMGAAATTTGTAVAASAVNFNKLRGAMTTVATSALQTVPGVVGLSSALGGMAIGAAPMVAVLAGLAAVAYAYKALTKDAKASAAAVKESTDELAKLIKLQRQGLVGSLTPGIVEAENEVQRLSVELRALAAAPAMIRALPWNISRMKELIGLIGEQNLLISTGEKRITELVTGEIKKQSDVRADAAKKQEDAAKKFFDAEKKRLEQLRLAAAKVAVRMSQLGTGQLLAPSGVGPIKPVQAGPNLNPTPATYAAPAAGGFMDRVKGEMGQVKGESIGAVMAQFGPLAAAAAALAPVFEGIRAAIGPAMEALAVPLKTIGMVIGSTIAPALKALEVPLRLLALASSYVVEGFGRLIKGIGDFLNKILPGNPFKFLVNYGKEMIAGAVAARASLDKVAESADRVSEAFSNVPTGFRIQQARFNASQGASLPTGGRGGLSIFGDLVVMSKDPKAVLAEIEKEAARARARGGNGLTLGYAG